MTNGSSQGLFVVVAVVIFGIFVAISYSLFRDQLTPSLASIFGDSASETNVLLTGKRTIMDVQNFTGFDKKSERFGKKGEVSYIIDNNDFYNGQHTLRLDFINIENEDDAFLIKLQPKELKGIKKGDTISITYDGRGVPDMDGVI